MASTKMKSRDERAAERREDLRARIGASNLLTDIEKVEDDVKAIADGPVIAESYDADQKEVATKTWLATSPIKIQAAKVLLDSKYKRLAKVLPDLKAVELSQDPDNPVFTDERTLDSHLERAAKLIAGAENRVASVTTGKGPVH